MSDAPELLPCPFCGSMAEIVEIDDGESAGGSCVCCTGCMASGNVEFGFKENFVSNWNRRADLAAAKDARIAELERQLAEAREVKPLGPWRDSSSPANGVCYASASFGAYFIERNNDGFFWVNHNDRGVAHCKTLESAKAAAQADYADRILSALKETP